MCTRLVHKKKRLQYYYRKMLRHLITFSKIAQSVIYKNSCKYISGGISFMFNLVYRAEAIFDR